MMFKLAKFMSFFAPLWLAGCASIINIHQVSFETKPCLVPVKDFTYQTCVPLRATIDQQMIIVPKGFKTDLASIPRVFWNILPPQQANFIAPAVLHDYLYETKNMKRKKADDILYSALRESGAKFITASIIWLAVRLFGGFHY